MFHKKKFISGVASLALVLFALSMNSCDPGMNGDLRVFNQTDSVLTVEISTYGNIPSATYVMEPHSEQIIHVLDGLGNQKAFECCPCELGEIRISSGNGVITKDPTNTDNWAIPNKSKQKKFGGEDLRCEFYVTPADL